MLSVPEKKAAEDKMDLEGLRRAAKAAAARLQARGAQLLKSGKVPATKPAKSPSKSWGRK